jgi:NADP-reducing hydrogenase subunit HndB
MSAKITSAEELKKLRDRAQAQVSLRSGPKEVQAVVHMGTCGIAAGARDVIAAFMRELAEQGVDHVTLRQSGCAGLCEEEPMITVTTADGTLYHYGLLDDGKVHRIVEEHLAGGTPAGDLLIRS